MKTHITYIKPPSLSGIQESTCTHSSQQVNFIILDSAKVFDAGFMLKLAKERGFPS